MYFLLLSSLSQAQTFGLKTKNQNTKVVSSTNNKIFTTNSSTADSIKAVKGLFPQLVGIKFTDSELFEKWKRSEIGTYKEALKFSNDTAEQRKLSDTIDKLKTNNSIAFLSKYKNTSFNLFKIGNYNIDSLNNYLYQQKYLDFLQSANIQNIGASENFINAEFGSYLFGPVKLGLGGSFKTTGDTTKNNAIKTSLQKLVTAGGTINLDFTLPIYFYRSRNEQFHFGIFGQMNNGLNPSISDTTGKTDFSSSTILYTNQTGVVFHFDVASNNEQATKITFEIPYYYSFGNNNSYKDLRIRDFSLIKLQAGLIINNIINLNLSGPLWSSSKAIQNTPFTLSLGFAPSLIIQKVNKVN